MALLAIVATIYFCWFRKRRRQIRARHAAERPRSDTSAGLERGSPVTSMPDAEIKRDFESRFSNEHIMEKVPTKSDEYDLERQATPPAPSAPPALSASQAPPAPPASQAPATAPAESPPRTPVPPPIPPPPPIPETAEMPIFITPRSSRSFFNSLRRPRTPGERPRTPAELDAGSRSLRSRSVRSRSGRSTRPASLNEADLEKAASEPSSPGRRSKRHSLHQVLHRKAADDECCKKPPRLADHPALRRAQTDIHDADKNSTHPPRRSRSKRLSLQGFLHLRRFAELEGSTVDVPPVPRRPTDDGDSPSRRSNRLSLHRLISSKKLAELEAHTDALPEYSKTDQNANMKRDSLPPPLPPKDKGSKESSEYKAVYSSSPHRRTMTPVELDASETQCRVSPAKSGIWAKRRSKLAATGSAYSGDGNSDEWADETSDDGYEDIQIHMAKSPGKAIAMDARAPRLEGNDFLDLGSTDSDEDDEDEHGSGRATLPPSLPILEEGNMDPFLTAEIISAAVEASSSRPKPLKPIHIANAQLRAKATEMHPAIHEMDATETAVKRRSKRTSHNVASTKGDGNRRRPDFLAFKKQMTEAERRAKMIAKRKSRRRFPKSF